MIGRATKTERSGVGSNEANKTLRTLDNPHAPEGAPNFLDKARVPAPTATTSKADWDEAWHRATTELRTPKSERDLAQMLTELAKQDPQRALSFVFAETNLTLRAKLRSAALRGWAETDALSAANWASALPKPDQDPALHDVFSTAASQPDRLIGLVSDLCGRDPSQTRTYGQALVSALSDVGAYDAAAQFALNHPALHVELLGPTYYEWAQHQPEQALASVNAITDPAARDEAFRGMIQGWSAANPSAVVGYVVNMAPGKERAQVLAEALPRWVAEDPSSASNWIGKAGASADFDDGRVAIATSIDLLAKNPRASADWAATIVDPDLRATTLQAVVQQWIQSDPASAGRFIQTEPKLQAQDRAALTSLLSPQPKE